MQLVRVHCLSSGCVYGTGIASETLFTSATELPVCPDTQASFICLYVFAMMLERALRELVVYYAMNWFGISDASGWPLRKRNVARALMTSHIATSTPLLLNTAQRDVKNMTKPRGIAVKADTRIMERYVIFTRDARKSRSALHVSGLPLSPSLLLYE